MTLALPGNVPLVNATETALAEVLKGGDYLPRLSVMGSNSDLVKEAKAAMGTLALVWTKEKFKEIGKEIDALAISVRPKAIRLEVPPIAFFKTDHPEFLKIMADSEKQNSKCAFGPEFLLYIPQVDEFATFHMGSKSARREAPNLVALMKPDGKTWVIAPTTIGVKYIKGGPPNNYSWHAPKINPCSTTLSLPDDQEELLKILEKFKNPPESAVEVVEEATESRPR